MRAAARQAALGALLLAVAGFANAQLASVARVSTLQQLEQAIDDEVTHIVIENHITMPQQVLLGAGGVPSVDAGLDPGSTQTITVRSSCLM